MDSTAVKLLFEDHPGQQRATATVTGALSSTPTLVSSSSVRRDPWGVVLEGTEEGLSRGFAGSVAATSSERFLVADGAAVNVYTPWKHNWIRIPSKPRKRLEANGWIVPE
jgi:hypothetical protein